MPRRERIIALAAIMWLGAAIAVSARGERSYVLPEVRESVPTSNAVVRTPSWSQVADVPGDGDMLAIGKGLVAFESRHRICGFDESTGARRWCAGPGANPVFASGVVAYLADDAGVRGIDATTGTPLWRRADATAVWRARNDFLTAGHLERGSANNRFERYCELDAAGRTVWCERLNAGSETFIAPPYAVLTFYSAGATMSKPHEILRLGAGGGFIRTLPFAWDLLDLRLGTAVVTTSPNEEVRDHFLTFDVEIDDLKSGSAKAHYHYEPDYDVNNALMNTNAYAGMGSGPVRVDGDDLYVMFFSQKIYRYRLRNASNQRPLLVASGVKFLGGPYRKTLYAERADGVWALRPEAHVLRSRHVAISKAGVADFSILGGVAYVIFNDGRMQGFDPQTGRLVLDSRPCMAGEKPMRVGGSSVRTYVACASRGPWRIVAYPKPVTQSAESGERSTSTRRRAS